MFQEPEIIENELQPEDVVETPEEVVEQTLEPEHETASEPKEVSETEDQAEQEPHQDSSKKEYQERERQRYQRKVQEYKQKSQQAVDVAKKLAEENLMLRQTVEGYGQAASHHYAEKLKLKIDQAQQKLEQAEIDADVKAKAEAIRELTKLAEEEAYLERYNYRNTQNTESSPQPKKQSSQEHQSSEPEDMEMPEEIEDWFDENPWLDQRRQEFNSQMRDEVYAYSQTLATQWKRLGKGSQIDSPEFLNELGKYARDNFPEYYSPTQHRRPPLNTNHKSMGQPPVRKQPTAPAPKFTQAEREMMKNFGMTEKEWLESKNEVDKRSRGIR